MRVEMTDKQVEIALEEAVIRAKENGVVICWGDFGVAGFLPGEVFESENNRMCPIGAYLLGKPVPDVDNGEILGAAHIITGVSVSWFSGFYYGFDNLSNYADAKKVWSRGYEAGQRLRAKYVV